MRAALLSLLLFAAPAAAQTPPASLPQAAIPTPHMVPLMGRRLFGPAGEELGRLVDLVVDADGRPLAVVVDVGGFMGLGIRRVALAWALLRFRVEPDMVRMSVEITPDSVTAAPEYRPGDPASILNPPARQ